MTKCSNCGSESGDVEYLSTGRRVFRCHSCFHWSVLPDRLEKDVGGNQ